jgi:hypothetical protein
VASTLAQYGSRKRLGPLANLGTLTGEYGNERQQRGRGATIGDADHGF